MAIPFSWQMSRPSSHKYQGANSPTAASRRFCPSLESLEERVLLSHAFYPSTDTPRSTNPPSNTDVVSTLIVPDSFNILDLNLSLDFVPDTTNGNIYSASLRGPDGTAISLFSRNGERFSGAIFDDQAATGLPAAGPYTDSYRPVGLLAAFNGKDIHGTWTLTISAVLFQGAHPSLNSWMLVAERPSLQPTVSITGPDPIQEGDKGTTDAVFTVRLSAPSATDVVVSYTVTPGTATEGVDYLLPANLTVTIPGGHGQTTATISIPIVGDSEIEGDETLSIKLSDVLNGNATITESQATASITNDDIDTLGRLRTWFAEKTTGGLDAQGRKPLLYFQVNVPAPYGSKDLMLPLGSFGVSLVELGVGVTIDLADLLGDTKDSDRHLVTTWVDVHFSLLNAGFSLLPSIGPVDLILQR